MPRIDSTMPFARAISREPTSSPAPPAPFHISLVRSASAIIATKSPIAETAIAPATSRRSRSRTVTPPENLRLGLPCREEHGRHVLLGRVDVPQDHVEERHE